jgi:hypothetical protein
MTLDWLSSNKKLVDNVIIRDLLHLKNSNWLQEEEGPLTEKDFINKVRLTSIIFSNDMSFDLDFDDGDIFAGHTIVVPVTTNRKVKNATIEG